MVFKLTETHIRNRHLDEIDFSTAAGFWLPVIGFRDLPYAAELLEDRCLSRRCLWQRANQIRLKLTEFDLYHPLGSFDWDDAKSAATGFSSIHYRVASPEGGGRGADHFQFLQDTDLRKKRRYAPADTLANFFPDLVRKTKNAPDAKLTTAFAILDREITAPQHWAMNTYLPEGLIANYPNDDKHVLFADIHEVGHIRNIRNADLSLPMKYARNLDSDLGAIYSFQDAKIGEETCRAQIHARYLSMLFSSPKYWYAASLEAHINGQELKDYKTTFFAVNEIRIRLSMFMSGKASLLTTSESLKTSIDNWHAYYLTEPKIDAFMARYCNNIAPRALRNPGFLYTSLDHLVDSGVFTDPFPEQLAARIVRAAKYSNPDLVSADNDASIARMRDQMGKRRFWRSLAGIVPKIA